MTKYWQNDCYPHLILLIVRRKPFRNSCSFLESKLRLLWNLWVVVSKEWDLSPFPMHVKWLHLSSCIMKTHAPMLILLLGLSNKCNSHKNIFKIIMVGTITDGLTTTSKNQPQFKNNLKYKVLIYPERCLVPVGFIPAKNFVKQLTNIASDLPHYK